MLHDAAAELMRQPFGEDEIDAEFDGAITQLRGGERKRAFALEQDMAQKIGVRGMSSDEKQQYLQAVTARANAGKAG